MGNIKSCQEQFNGILKNMAQTLLVTDWKPEVSLTIGPASLRVYPSNDGGKVQSQWMALDAWVAIRGTLRGKAGQTPIKFSEKEKQTARSLFMISFLIYDPYFPLYLKIIDSGFSSFNVPHTAKSVQTMSCLPRK